MFHQAISQCFMADALHQLDALESGRSLLAPVAKHAPDNEPRHAKRNEQTQIFEKDTPTQFELPR
jgi:hypothetical protein